MVPAHRSVADEHVVVVCALDADALGVTVILESASRCSTYDWASLGRLNRDVEKDGRRYMEVIDTKWGTVTRQISDEEICLIAQGSAGRLDELLRGVWP
jgi:hypothetical protein